ncbi:MAG: GTP-binding protein [Lachnospiraceae bacterium]|nr:GTP-binding protein [Lachnospiraceae bacterium]
MTKIDIVSGFLGAGKTTLIKKLLKEALGSEQVVLIENEFGEIGIDGGFLKEAGIEITEMNSGCICCSLVGDFGTALKEVLEKYHPDRILIEPSGVGKLSDVMRALPASEVSGDPTGSESSDKEAYLNSAVAVVDAKKCKPYLKNFGEFFENQIEHAGTIILSRTGDMSDEKVNACVELIREHNPKATIITTPWDKLEGKKILETIEGAKDLEAELMKEVMEKHAHDHEHEHHHHHEEHEHYHHHDHGEGCTCGCHDHDHAEGIHADSSDASKPAGSHTHSGMGSHHHHDADEVFTSIGIETSTKYTKEKVEECLEELDDSAKYGTILRCKGMLPTDGEKFIHFDYVPGECEVRDGAAEVTGKICVIGSELREEKIRELFK